MLFLSEARWTTKLRSEESCPPARPVLRHLPGFEGLLIDVGAS